MDSQIILGDCLKILPTFPNKCVDVVITDPPYGKNYKKIIGDENLETYTLSLPLIYNVLKNNSFFISFCFPYYIPIIISEAEFEGFEYLWLGFIYYPNMFKQKPQPLGYNRYDSFLIFGKGKPKKSGFIKDVVHVVLDKGNSQVERGHPHQKPEKAYEKLIKATTKEGDVVLDPFLGSGTAMVVAKRMNRKCIGIEIDKEYYELAKKRTEEQKI